MLFSYVDRIFFISKSIQIKTRTPLILNDPPALLSSYANMHALRFCIVMGYIGYQSCRDRRQECGILHTPTGKKLKLLLNPWLFVRAKIAITCGRQIRGIIYIVLYRFGSGDIIKNKRS